MAQLGAAVQRTPEIKALCGSCIKAEASLRECTRDADGRVEYDVLRTKNDSLDDGARAYIDVSYKRDGGPVWQDSGAVVLIDLECDHDV